MTVKLISQLQHTVHVGDGLDAFAIPPQGVVEAKKAPSNLPAGIIVVENQKSSTKTKKKGV